jgi:hypothetical protein
MASRTPTKITTRPTIVPKLAVALSTAVFSIFPIGLAVLPTLRKSAVKGKRLSSLAQLAKTLTFTPVTVSLPDGRERTEHVAEIVCLLYGPFHTRPIKLLLIRGADRADGYDFAIASIDTGAAAAELIARYVSRWTIETCIQEGNANGIGQARNRVRRAVERTVRFAFLTQTITVAWYQVYGDADRDVRARRRTAPWYRHKQTVSYSDMLVAIRREFIRAEFHAQAPRRPHSPEIAPAQSPPALTAALDHETRGRTWGTRRAAARIRLKLDRGGCRRAGRRLAHASTHWCRPMWARSPTARRRAGPTEPGVVAECES